VISSSQQAYPYDPDKRLRSYLRIDGLTLLFDSGMLTVQRQHRHTMWS